MRASQCLETRTNLSSLRAKSLLVTRGRAGMLRLTGPVMVVCALAVASLPPFGP